MTRILLSTWSLLTLAASSFAGEPSVRLRVHPMPLPMPALKYQLLPELGELKPGNPAQNYLKCFMEQRPFFYGAKSTADRARYQTMALADLPLNELKSYGGNALRQADWAARLDTLDWEALERVQRGDFDNQAGELGPLQILISALNVRFRAEIGQKRFEDAIRTAKTKFALARHLGEYPTEVANQVGLWAASQTLAGIEEMAQQPGCPNLYWALSDLPSPLVEVRKGVQGQRATVAALLRPLRDDAPMTESELETFVSRQSGVLSFAREQAGRPPWKIRAFLQEKANDPGRVDLARRRLAEAGSARERINKLPALQVILLDDERRYELERDARVKLLAVPIWQVGVSPSENDRERGVFTDFLPDVNRLRLAQGRLQQQIAALRHVEALRNHAAEHDGQLPAKLADLSVPPPLDPITGRSFDYTVESGTVHIRGGSVRNGETGPGLGLHYEVIVQTESKRRP
jgi:hypothetical protein